MDTIAAKLESGRRSLLDLSARNRLLNLPAGPGRHLHPVAGNMAETCERLVRQGQPVPLPPGIPPARLQAMAQDALTALDEQGVHTLHLALGLLRWREAPSPA